MAYPAAFIRYANLVVEGKTYNTPEKLWAAAAPDKDIVMRLGKANCKGAIDFALVQKLADVHAKMRKKAGNNRGGRAQQPATQAVTTARKHATHGVPNLTDMDMVDDQLFGIDGVGPSVLIDIEDVNETTTGHSLASVGAGTRALQKFLDSDKFDGVFTLVCKSAAFQDALPSTKASYRQRYEPTEGKVLFACRKTGNLHEVAVILFHFGEQHTDIRECDNEVTVTLPDETSKFIQLSIQMPNFAGTAEFGTKGKAAFVKNATLAVGAANLSKDDQLPMWTRTHNDVPFVKQTIDIHEGKVSILRDKYDDVLRRCGLQGILLRPWGRDNDFGILPLHPKSSMDEARAAATKMGSLAYGFCLTPRGFAIRIKKAEEIKAKEEFNPELATAMGNDIMRLQKREGHFYKVCGVPFHLTDVQLVQALKVTSGLAPNDVWTAKPLRKMPGAPFGYKNILVQAPSPAPTRVIRFRHGSEIVPLHLMPQQQDYKTLPTVDKVIAQELKHGGNKSVALETKKIPLKTAGWNFADVVKSSKASTSWDDMTTEEEENPAEFDSEGYPVDPGMTVDAGGVFPRIPVRRAPSPPVVHLPNADVDDRFAALERQRETMAQDTQKLVDDAKEREQKFKTQSDRMFDQLTDLQTLIKNNQEANDARMKLIEERSNVNEKLANKRFSELMAAVTGNKSALVVDTSADSTNDDEETKDDADADKPHDMGDRAKRSPRRAAPYSGDVRAKA